MTNARSDGVNTNGVAVAAAEIERELDVDVDADMCQGAKRASWPATQFVVLKDTLWWPLLQLLKKNLTTRMEHQASPAT